MVALLEPYWCLWVFVVGGLAFFSVHRMVLAVAAGRLIRQIDRGCPPSPIRYPSVLVQVPVYNEPNVIERVIDAVCALEYPADRLSIQILDDSTDCTSALAVGGVQRWRCRGIDVVHLRRGSRSGYKAGALRYGLTQSNAELVAIFDADFVPSGDFLLRLVAHFDDPSVGMVQARWDYLNAEMGMLTRGQQMLLDGHFINEHGGRAWRKCFFNFNGTAGIWRRACIDDAGGWLSRTITEDLDLSYRAQLRGWRFVYRPDVCAPCELPPDVDSFKVQQHRWAKGGIETAIRLLPQIWTSPGLSWRVRIESTFHLGGNLAYPLVLVLGIMLPFAPSRHVPGVGIAPELVNLVLFLATMGSLGFFYVSAALRAGRGWGALRHLPVALAIGAGLAINNCRALVEALVGFRTPFVRTPKVGSKKQSVLKHSSGVGEVGQSALEVFFGMYLAVGGALVSWDEAWWLLPLLGLFAGGFLFLGFGSVYNRLKASGSRSVSESITISAQSTET